MAIDFPNSPSVNDSFTVGNRTWIWDGTAWELLTTTSDPIQKTIVDAKGDLIGGTGSDTVARLAVGTNEHRLVADSGETTGLKYVADTTNYAVGAKGDLLVGTAADTVSNLAVGTNDYVLTADSAEATGMKWAAAAGGGKLLQVVSGTTTTSNTNTSGSYADTNLTASITPTAATSKILVLVSQLFQVYQTGADNAGHAVRLLRDASAIYTPAQTSPFTTYISVYGNTEVVFYYNLALTYLDSPATTSSITYKTQHNDSNGDSVAQPGTSGGSTITLLEIGV